MKKSYHSLQMWHSADELVKLIYIHSKVFPRHETYGLTSQLRRAALSVVLNIVEGYARTSKAEFKRFLDISLASLSEVEYLLELALDFKYLDQVSYNDIEFIRSKCGKQIWSYRYKIGK